MTLKVDNLPVESIGPSIQYLKRKQTQFHSKKQHSMQLEKSETVNTTGHQKTKKFFNL